MKGESKTGNNSHTVYGKRQQPSKFFSVQSMSFFKNNILLLFHSFDPQISHFRWFRCISTFTTVMMLCFWRDQSSSVVAAHSGFELCVGLHSKASVCSGYDMGADVCEVMHLSICMCVSTRSWPAVVTAHVPCGTWRVGSCCRVSMATQLMSYPWILPHLRLETPLSLGWEIVSVCIPHVT